MTPRRLVPLLALSALATLATGLHGQGLCQVRNAGSNPAGFACTNDPTAGGTWMTTVDIATPGASASFVQVFLGGPLPGVPLAIGRLLCAPPALPRDVAAGVHAIPIPNDAALVGQSFCTQAATVSFGPLEVVLQNALDITIGGAGADTVTVLVVADDEDDSTPPQPVPGARVTLRGTDAASAGGAAGTTDANGEVLFPLVSGPYDVTAQVDVDDGGTITRYASSVLGVDPVSGTIGVLLFLDAPEPDVDATLEGTVVNLPALSGFEYLEVLVRGHGSVDFEDSTSVNPLTGHYSLPVPSGVDLDLAVLHRGDFTQPSSQVLSSLFEPGIGQIGTGGTLVVDLDLADPAVVPWTTPVAVTVTNAHPALVTSVQAVFLDPLTGTRFELGLREDAPGSFGLLLPDVTDPDLAAYAVSLGVDTFDPFDVVRASQECESRLATTPASATLPLFSLPFVTSPLNLSTLTLAELEGLTFSWLEAPTGAFGANGLDLVFLSTEQGLGGPAPAGIDQATWTVFARAGATSFDLPPADLPMFEVDQRIACEVLQVRLAGTTLDYDDFFDEGVAASFQGVVLGATGTCQSAMGVEVFTVP